MNNFAIVLVIFLYYLSRFPQEQERFVRYTLTIPSKQQTAAAEKERKHHYETFHQSGNSSGV
ncbi:hypothetical protein [Selenomonas ruminantium]|uniref:hypothetical protein n=1 Tax=Selenomonas ruminantium TaxID=971 RepID=UPI001B7F96BD|nr:hypothetical protein [Selenomonas ruminantium]